MSHCCRDPDIINCYEVSINTRIIKSRQKFSIGGVEFYFSSWEYPSGYIFENNFGDVAHFTLNQAALKSTFCRNLGVFEFY